MTYSDSEIENEIRSLDVSQPLSILRRLESVAWGTPFWRLIDRISERRQEKLLDATAVAEKKLLRRHRAIGIFVQQAIDFGRMLNKPMRQKARSLRATGVSPLLIRDAVIGRILTNTGSLNLDDRRRRVLLILGSLWHAIAIFSTSLLMILAITLPGAVPAKMTVVVILVALLVFSSSFFNAIAIRAGRAIRYYQTLCSENEHPPSPQLRAVN